MKASKLVETLTKHINQNGDQDIMLQIDDTRMFATDVSVEYFHEGFRLVGTPQAFCIEGWSYK